MRTLTIFCDGGLGNRLNSLVGGLLFADQLKVKVKIAWPQNNWCGCKFTDLFESTIESTEQDVNALFYANSSYLYLSFINPNASQILYHVPSLEALRLADASDQNIVYHHNKVPKEFTYKQILDAASTLRIKYEILDEVRAFCSRNYIDKQTQGCHFRKTDFPNPIDSETVFNVVRDNPHIKNFVCSDDKATEDQFAALPNVVVYPKTSYVEKLVDGAWHTAIKDTSGRSSIYNVNRNQQSVIEAFIDMLILSKTKIFTRNKSTFLSWAYIWGEIL